MMMALMANEKPTEVEMAPVLDAPVGAPEVCEAPAMPSDGAAWREVVEAFQ